MKKYSFLYIMSLLLFFAGCKEDEVGRIAPEGDFAVNFTLPEGVVTAPAKLVLTNRSKYSEKYLWKFPKGVALTKEGLTDRSTSESLVPDTVFYSLPGEYSVTLLAWQGGKVDSITKSVTVVKMQPQIVPPVSIGIMGEVQFSAKVFKYPGVDVSYSWDFGEAGLTSTEANPKAIFQNEGIHTVKLTINDGQESLTATVDVVVKGELVKTLYFTDAKTGKLYKKRFTVLQQSNPIQLPLNTGLHPWSITVAGERLVISATGANAYFTGAAADGRIYAVDLNGGNEKTITRGVGTGNDDPFASTVDNSGTVWWMSRNANTPGIRTLPLTAEDVAYPATKFVLTAAQAGATSVYGWLDGDIQNVNGNIWYTKQGSAGKGMFKLTDKGVFIESIAALKDVKIRSFAVDTKNSKIYFSVNYPSTGFPKGLYVSNLDGTNPQLIDALANFSEEGNPNEQTYVTAIVVDNAPDDGTAGYVYYGYRDMTEVSSTGVLAGTGANSGIKRYAIGGGSQPTFFLKGFIPYGIAIDHVKR